MISGNIILLVDDHAGDTAIFLAAARQACPQSAVLMKTGDIKELAVNLRELTTYWLQRGMISKQAGDGPAGTKGLRRREPWWFLPISFKTLWPEGEAWIRA